MNILKNYCLYAVTVATCKRNPPCFASVRQAKHFLASKKCSTAMRLSFKNTTSHRHKFFL